MKAIPLSYIARNLWVRRVTTLLTAGGMALVVYTFATVLMMSEGIRATLVATGQRDNVLVLRKRWSSASPVATSIAELPATGAARRLSLAHVADPLARPRPDQPRKTPENQAPTAANEERVGPLREAPGGASAPKKESSRSGWRMRSVAVPSYEQRTAGSLRRK